MEAGDHYWWIKEAGVKHPVEIVTTQFKMHPDNPSEVLSKTVMVRILNGPSKGIYTIVSPNDLSIN
jgi:hypothetical protein